MEVRPQRLRACDRHVRGVRVHGVVRAIDGSRRSVTRGGTAEMLGEADVLATDAAAREAVLHADAVELTVSMAIAVGVRVYALDARYVPTPSMEPTFAVGDHLLVDKVSRRFQRLPRRGDVVCFRPPVEVHDLTEGSCYMKRVVGVEGDMVEVKGGRLIVSERIVTPSTCHQGAGRTRSLPHDAHAERVVSLRLQPRPRPAQRRRLQLHVAIHSPSPTLT